MFAAIESYLRLCEAGKPPAIDAFISEHGEIANELRACLAGLAFLQKAAPNIELSSADLAQQAPGCSELAVASSAGGSGVNDLGPEPLGDYRLIREIGRGGMGIVYEAEQLSLSRRVALKILPFAAVLDPRHLQRFKNEALAAAHLAHPNIVDVYGIGCERGIHFYAMRLIEGQTLAAVIDALGGRGSGRAAANDEAKAESREPKADESLEPGTVEPSACAAFGSRLSAFDDTEVVAALSTLRTEKPRDFFLTIAELGIQAAEALDHAHQMGIVHRDIKPSNLMVEAKAESRKRKAEYDPGGLQPSACAAFGSRLSALDAPTASSPQPPVPASTSPTSASPTSNPTQP